MNENLRLALLVTAIVLVLAAVWHFFPRGDEPELVTVETASRAQETRPGGGAIQNARPAPSTAEAPSRMEARQDALPASTRDLSARGARSGNGVIRGVVKRKADDVPVSGARVVAEWRDWEATEPPRPDAPRWEATTGPDGSYRIDRLPVADPRKNYNVYGIVAEKGGESGVGQARLNYDTHDQAANIVIEPAGTIAGVVVNEAGEPVEGAVVMLAEPSDVPGGATPRAPVLSRGHTDAEGRFELRHVPLANWKLAARAEGYAVLTSEPVPVDTGDVELVLTRGAEFAGRVVFADSNEPAPGIGVQVAATRGPLNAHKASTGEDGRFAVAALADGEYFVNLQDESLIVIGTVPLVKIANAQPPAELEIRVAKGGVVTGRAYDVDSGEPLADVRITTRNQLGGMATRTAFTESDGTYRLEGLSPGMNVIGRRWYQGYLHGEAREDKSVNVTLGAAVAGIDFPMKRGLNLRGKVVDEDGRPLDQVSVHSQTMRAQNPEGETATTGEDGTFEHRGFSENVTVYIVAQRQGYSSATAEGIRIGSEDVEGIELVLRRGQRIAGIVVDRHGRPLSNARIMATPQQMTQPRGFASAGPQTGVSDIEGRFTIEGLGPGAYQLQGQTDRAGRSGSRLQMLETVTVAQGQNISGLRLVLDAEQGGEVIAGRVLDSSRQPIQDVSISASARDHTLQSWGSARTDAEGRFEITGLEQTNYYLYAQKQGYTAVQREEVQAGDRNVEVLLNGTGTIEGRVINAVTSRPFTQFEVGYVPAYPGMNLEQMMESGMLPSLQAYVDPDGHYRLDGVNIGDVVVIARAEGFAPQGQMVSGIREGQARTGVDFRLAAGGVIAGRVLDGQSRPIANAQVYLGRMPRDDWSRQQNLSATSDAEGRFRLESLASQTYQVSVAHADYVAATVDAAVSAGRTTEVTVVLGQGGAVSGHVRLNGAPLPGANVQVIPQDGSPQQGLSARTGPNGEYSIAGAPVGTVMVQAHYYAQDTRVSRSTMPQNAIIASGQTTVVDFDLSAGNASIEGYVTLDGAAPVGGHVSAMYDEGASMSSTGGQLQDSGYYRLDGLPGNTNVTLMVQAGGAPGAGPTMRSIQVRTVDGRTVRQDIDLSGGAALNGSVHGANPGEVLNIMVVRGEVELDRIDMNTFVNLRTQMVGATGAQVGDEGAANFQIPGLESGSYTVVVISMDPGAGRAGMDTARVATYPLTVREGEAPRLDIQAP